MGSTNRSAAAATRTAGAAALPLLALLALAASPAGAARVEQVRVGDHEDFTRVVVELDAPASYRWAIREGSSGLELVLELDARSTTRSVASRSTLVKGVELRPAPDGAGTTARVGLRVPAVDVKEMVLPDPQRIVLDLRRASPRPAVRPAAGGSAAPPAVTLRVDPSAPAEREPVAASEPAEEEAAAAQPEAEPAPARRTVGRARVDAAPEAPGSAPEAGGPVDAAGAGPEDPAEPDSGAAPGAGGAPEATGTAAAPEGPLDDPVSRARREAAAAAAARERAVAPEPPAASSPPDRRGWLERLLAGDPAVGLVAAAVGILLLFLAFVALRKRSARLAREAAATPWPPPGAEERPEFEAGRREAAAAPEAWAADAEQEAQEAVEPARAAAGEPMGPLFSEPPPEPEAPAAGAGMAAAGAPLEPEVEAKDEADGPLLEELERRIERLEARLADGLDARERLERQLAAHTEELRVQRAAIARTQRAVRAAVRGPEAPGSEPTGTGGDA